MGIFMGGKKELPLEGLAVAGYVFEPDRGMFQRHQRSLSAGALVAAGILTVTVCSGSRQGGCCCQFSDNVKISKSWGFDSHFCSWVTHKNSQRNKICLATWTRRSRPQSLSQDGPGAGAGPWGRGMKGEASRGKEDGAVGAQSPVWWNKAS